MIYFDHAATSYPKPAAVIRTMNQCMRDYCGNPGRSAHRLSLRAAEEIYRVRCLAAEMFGCSQPENVVFASNATYALNMALKGLLKSGDHVLISEIEHNSVLRPIERLTKTGVKYDVYPVAAGGVQLEDKALLNTIREKIRPNTVLVVANHVSNVCGMRLPIRKIGALLREKRVPFLVDASQSAGVYDLHVENDGISYLCMAGHKGLLGPQGTGMLIVGAEAAVPEPFADGGNGINSLDPSMPDFLPERMEAGTLATPGIVGLGAGMRYAGAMMQEIRENNHRMYRRLMEMLCNSCGVTVYAKEAQAGGTILFNVDGVSSNSVAAALDEKGICARSGFHCAPLAHRMLKTNENGAVRISFGFGNKMAEAEHFAKALKEINASFGVQKG